MSEVLLILIVVVALVAIVFAARSQQVTTIYAPHVGLLYRNGRFRRELGPGRYSFFDPLQRTRIVKVAQAPLPVSLGELTVLTRDQFSLRVGLSPIMEVVDPRAFIESQPVVEPSAFNNFMPQVPTHGALHALTSSAAMEVVSGVALRELLTEPALLTGAVQGRLDGAIPGARIAQVLLTSVTLPPETRKMFTEVERSKLEAEAALERSRGEQASLRALANAARLIKDNPALANLRFLQTVERSPGPKTIVFGGNGAGQLGGELGPAA